MCLSQRAVRAPLRFLKIESAREARPGGRGLSLRRLLRLAVCSAAPWLAEGRLEE